MGRIKDITGKRFGLWEVIEYSGTSKGLAGVAMWKCKCDCGEEKVIHGTALRQGTTTSCGCVAPSLISSAQTTHGMTKTRTYISWKAMRNRCNCETSPDYELYGKRGIKVCARWDSFENFVADMGERPKGMTLDRICNDGPYSKENCRWATSAVQSRNKRTSVFVEFDGKQMTLSEFGERIGMDRRNVRYWIITKGYTPEQVASQVATVTKKGGLSSVEGALCP